jgi:hypothetical protein
MRSQDQHPTELYRELLGLSRELTQLHLRMLEVCAVLEGLTGIEIIERIRPEPAPRHLRLVRRGGGPAGDED